MEDVFIPTATSHDETARAADAGVLPVGSFEQHHRPPLHRNSQPT